MTVSCSQWISFLYIHTDTYGRTYLLSLNNTVFYVFIILHYMFLYAFIHSWTSFFIIYLQCVSLLMYDIYIQHICPYHGYVYIPTYMAYTHSYILCSSDCLQICHPSVSASRVLGLQLCTTTPGCDKIVHFYLNIHCLRRDMHLVPCADFESCVSDDF